MKEHNHDFHSPRISMKTEISPNGIMMTISILTVITQCGLYLLSGGFAAGGKLSEMSSDIKLLRQEIAATNQIHDYRLDKLEGGMKK